MPAAHSNPAAAGDPTSPGHGEAPEEAKLAVDQPELETPLYEPLSRLEGPIDGLTFLGKSLVFAELSKISYLPRADAGRAAKLIGLPETRFYDRDGAQAYLFGTDSDAVIVCRGTEPNQWNDIRADLDAATALAETGGRVHRGFKREVDDLWPRLEQALVSNERVLWFAGHSLGGAMTAICAGRCYLSHIRSNPRAVFTYGSPRVGNKRFINHVPMEYYRWVNNNDIVTRVPPRWLGYAHGGVEAYLDRKGRVSTATGLWRRRDRLRGLLRALGMGKLDYLQDHLMNEYIYAIRSALRLEETGAPPRKLVEALGKIEGKAAKVRAAGAAPAGATA